jgi:Vinculin family.
VSRMDKRGKLGPGGQPAHTVQGRLEQARAWLAHPERDDAGLGVRAISLILDEGKKVSKAVFYCVTFLYSQHG